MGTITRNGNVFVCTSCCSGLVTRQNVFVKQVYWYQPVLGVTSGVMLRTKSGKDVVSHLKCEMSGASQVMTVEGWRHGLWLENMPEGTLYIYLE